MFQKIWKTIGHFILIAMITGFLTSTPGSAQESINKVEDPTEIQQKVIDSIFRDISEEQQFIQRHFKDLQDLQMIDEQGQTVILLSTKIRNEVGTRERHLINERAVIQWKNENIQEITFHQRKGLIGGGNVLKRELKYHVMPREADTAMTPIDFVVSEFINTTNGDSVNFRYPSGSGEVRDHKEVIQVRGVKKEMMVIYIRDVQSRIEILRENVRMLKHLRRRIEWLIAYEAKNRKNNIRKYLEF